MKTLLSIRVSSQSAGLRSSKARPFICKACLASKRYSTTTTTTKPVPPSALPPVGHALLSNRRLISIAGPDAPKFLQGLITASIYEQRAGEVSARTEGFYTGLLTAQGRVLDDLFIYPNIHHYGIAEGQKQDLVPGQAFLIEVDAERVDKLMALIRRYKLRSAYTHRRLERDECLMWSYWNDNKLPSEGSGEKSSSISKSLNNAYAIRDTRAPDLGYRIITPNKGTVNADKGLDLDGSQEPCSQDVYTIRRMLRGVPEGSAEIVPEKTLPMEANMDLMGGIDFRKGCYVGQELTIRTRHRGVVRRRMLPCVVYGEDEPVPTRLEYKADALVAKSEVPRGAAIARVVEGGSNAPARKVGSWIAGLGNIGLASCRLQAMTDLELPGESVESSPFDPKQEFVVQADDAVPGEPKMRIRAFVPDWMRRSLAEETVGSKKVEPS